MHKKQLFSVVAMATVIGGVGVLQAEQSPIPVVSEVTMRQVDFSRNVEISYKLTAAPAIITLAIETNGVAIPDSAVTRLSGDVSVVVQPGEGTKSITWNAGADWPDNITDVATARVTAWTLDYPPQYAAVDVTGGANADNYPVYYYPSAEGVANGITDDIYKTTRILLRRIEPTGSGGFNMGSPATETGRTAREGQVNVVLTSPYYIGVYQVTQLQWLSVVGSNPSWFTHKDYADRRPVEYVSYLEIRESATYNSSDPGCSWPGDGHTVSANFFMGKLRDRTDGVLEFDLPTEAQWEWACRAGTTGALNDGTTNLENSTSDSNLDLLGRYASNGGTLPSGVTEATATGENGPAMVGSYQPNAWGLYDMHGNVYEWCLDWYASSLPGGIDPEGPGSADKRVRRGGSWGNAASYSRSAFCRNDAPSFRTYGLGLRVAAAPVVSF